MKKIIARKKREKERERKIGKRQEREKEKKVNEKDRQREGRNEFHHLILERSRVADGCRRGMSWPRESVAISILTSRT